MRNASRATLPAALAELVLAPARPDDFWRASAAAQAAAPTQGPRELLALLARDWPNLCRFKGANAALDGRDPPTAVFTGDSITEGWVAGDAELVATGVVGRGIGGQRAIAAALGRGGASRP